MKDYKSNEIRNVILVGHGGCGKTSTAEAMLYIAGKTDRLGRTDAGTSVLDYDADELDRKITINLGIAYYEWKERKVNLLDTPGYFDFVGEVKSALRVADAGIVVMDAQSGVEVGTEKVWEYLDDYNLPRMLFINKMNKENADFGKSLDSAKEILSKKLVPFTIPIGTGNNFRGVVDLIKMKALIYDPSKDDGKFKEESIPADMMDVANEYREKLIESAAETDDKMIEKFFESGTLEDSEIKICLNKGIKSGTIIPVFCGSSSMNIGIQSLMDTIVDYFPSPVDMQNVEGVRPGTEEKVSFKVDENAPLSAFVFKTLSEQHLGELSFVRLYSGTLTSGMDLYNVNRSATERIGQMFFNIGKNRESTSKAVAGDIISLVKLKNTHTGDTLCYKSDQIQLKGIDFPIPLTSISVKPKKKGDEDKIGSALSRIKEEDPSARVELDTELRQTLLYGMGELHLDVLLTRMRRKFGVEIETLKPRIAYREAIRSTVSVQGKYKKQSGGRGQYGDVWLKLEPLERGKQFEFIDQIVGGVVPSKYIPAVEKGVLEAMQNGVIAGYPVVDVRVTIYDGTYHPVDSSDMAFRIAGSMAFKKGVEEAKPVLLEPILHVEVTVPDECMGDVIGDLSSRRGKVLGMDSKKRFQVIKALVPQAEMHNYSTQLRSITQGRGLYTQKFSHYEQVPQEIAERVIAEAKKSKEEQQEQ